MQEGKDEISGLGMKFDKILMVDRENVHKNCAFFIV